MTQTNVNVSMVCRNVQCQHVILVTGLKHSVQCERTARQRSTTSCCLDNLVHSVYLKIKIITFSHNLVEEKAHSMTSVFTRSWPPLVSNMTHSQIKLDHSIYMCVCECVCCQHFVVTVVSLRCNVSPQRNQSMPTHIGLPLAMNDASVSQPMEREDKVSH